MGLFRIFYEFTSMDNGGFGNNYYEGARGPKCPPQSEYQLPEYPSAKFPIMIALGALGFMLVKKKRFN